MIDNNESKRRKVRTFLKKNYSGEFIISKTPNEDGKFEVSSNGYLNADSDITSLTNGDFIFTKVLDFDCHYCYSLKTLEGAPKEVRKFYCNDCSSLKSLKGAPQKVKKFNCRNYN